MPHRLEIALKPELRDPEGDGIRRKARAYFGLCLKDVRTVHIVTIDKDLAPDQRERIRRDLFTNPVTQISSYNPLAINGERDCDWVLWIGFRPGVRDNAGATAMEAVSDLLGIRFEGDESIYTSKRYCLRGDGLSRADVDRLARELLANDIIQQWRVFSAADWHPEQGVGYVVPKVILNHVPAFATIAIDSDATLRRISRERNLALHPDDIPVIRAYFGNPKVRQARAEAGLYDPTDVELEYISQARSDHCNHNTFRGLFRYRETPDSPVEVVDNLFKTCIEAPTLALKAEKDWVVSVLWDNAGAGRFDENHYYVITGETHNSPSNMEAYGGAITGIVGVYRDPMGTGKGSRLVMGCYGYCVGRRDYDGPLKPRLHPRRLLDGVVEGVRDGGNKSGVPTPFGQVVFHDGYMGKCLVFVTAVGMMPARIAGAPADQKTTSPGDIAVMCGGRVGKDGIHGVTASSESFSQTTPAGHVQIGDPYTQKKMHDFLLEARDQGLVAFITDNGGGGLSSSIGESARMSGGCRIDLEKVPLKYAGLDMWEIWVSESQERMTVAVRPEHLERFMALSETHAVESTAIGEYTDSGKLHIAYDGRTCAYVDMDFLESGFPQWRFDAVWLPPSLRGLCDPVLGPPQDCNRLLCDMMARPNLASKEWISRQYDHEVQGASVVKPLVGRHRDVPADAAVIRPVLSETRGLAVAQALIPQYSAIDAYHMVACTIDEAVRRLLTAGARLSHMGGVDNFCWPSIQHDPETNPDGAFKAAQLVRACRALKEMCLAYGIPLLSGKDSMYVDGHLTGPYGETRKVSALETLQFTTIGVVADVRTCLTLDPKAPGDLIYVVGLTKPELGGSEYYEHLGCIGRSVPQVDPAAFLPCYKAFETAAAGSLMASARGIYRGGLAVHLALSALAGDLGMRVDLGKVPADGALRTDALLFSESAGRWIATVDPRRRDAFESLFQGMPCACVGETTESRRLVASGGNGETVLDVSLDDLRSAWKSPFGDLI